MENRLFKTELDFGHLICFVGPMKSGKTKQLIDTYLYWKGKGYNCIVSSVLYDKTQSVFLTSRCYSDMAIECSYCFKSTAQLKDFVEKLPSESVLIVDELQFMTLTSIKSLVDIIKLVEDRRINIFASLLSNDYKGGDWPMTSVLFAHADRNEGICQMRNCKAVCEICGKTATHTIKEGGLDTKIEIKDIGNVVYKPACFNCWYTSFSASLVANKLGEKNDI